MRQLPRPDRREALRVLGGGAILLVWRPACAAAPELISALRDAFGTTVITEARVSLRLPRLAESGYVVPVTVTVDSPMSATDYVRSIHVFAQDNPQPRVFDAFLGPHNARASVSSRIRLAVSQQVLAVAVMSDGSLWSASAEVEVTVGGCNP